MVENSREGRRERWNVWERKSEGRTECVGGERLEEVDEEGKELRMDEM